MVEFLIIGFVFTLGLGFFSFNFVKNRRQTKMMKMQSSEIQKNLLDLEQHNRQLQEITKEKLQLISLVSHDLKGPFNRIFALVQLVNLQKENLTTEQTEYMGKIQQIAADGLGMVRNLLDNRRFEDKGIELRPLTFDLSTLVFALTRNYRAIAEKKKITVELDAPNQLNVKADKLYLGRVIENLFSNAIKFSNERKKIVVKLRRLPDVIEFSVKDEGPGISPEDQLKLYQRFQRLTARPTGGESSTGLGLFIVKTILDKIGGEIRCESELRQGTCFTVRLPKKFLA